MAKEKSALDVFLNTPIMLELRGEVRPFRVYTGRKKGVIPAVKGSVAYLMFSSNAELPSNEHIRISDSVGKQVLGEAGYKAIKRKYKDEEGVPPRALIAPVGPEPFNLINSLPPLFSGYSFADVASVYVVPLFLDRLLIWGLTGVELVCRTVGALLNYPGHKANQWIDANVSSGMTKNALKAGVFLLTLPSQVCTLAADAVLYTKQLIDSAVHLAKLINPYWWAMKVIGKSAGVDSEVPSLKLAGTTFLKAAVNLLPTAAIVVAAVFTAGTTLPILNAVAAPLQVLAVSYIGGAFAAAGKFLSAAFQGALKVYGSNDAKKDKTVDLRDFKQTKPTNKKVAEEVEVVKPLIAPDHNTTFMFHELSKSNSSFVPGPSQQEIPAETESVSHPATIEASPVSQRKNSLSLDAPSSTLDDKQESPEPRSSISQNHH